MHSVGHAVEKAANTLSGSTLVLRGMIDSDLALGLYKALKMLIGGETVLEPQERYLDKAVEVAFESRAKYTTRYT